MRIFVKPSLFLALLMMWCVSYVEAQNSITVTPRVLQFSYAISGAIPPPQTIQISQSTGGTAILFTARPSVPWIRVNPDSLQNLPVTLSISVLPAALGPGAFNGNIPLEFITAGADVTVNVSLNLSITSVDPNAAQNIITTVVGNGSVFASGDGFAATSAGIPVPMDVAVDRVGRMYITANSETGIYPDCFSGCRIRRVSLDGAIETFASVPPTSAPSLTALSGLAIDTEDKVYVAQASASGDRVWRVDQQQSSIIANTNLAFDLFGYNGIVVDRNGNKYVSSPSRHQVMKISPTGVTSNFAGRQNINAFGGDGGTATSASLNTPRGLALDSIGNLYIADSQNHRVRRVDMNGIISTVAGSGGPDGGFSGDGGLATNARLAYPQGLAMGATGSLYIADMGNSRVRRVDANGIITTFAGSGSKTNCFGSECYSGDGRAAVGAQLSSNIRGISLDSGGALFIADTGNNRIRKVTRSLPPPSISFGGVVSNASFAPSPAAIAPLGIAAVFGTNLNNGSTILSSSFGTDGKLATTLGGTSVRVNGLLAPIFYSTSNQLGIQIPAELFPGVAGGQTLASIVVTVEGVSSPPLNFSIAPTAPGLFTTNQQGLGLAAALHSDGITPVSLQNPARRNEVIVFFATGLGAVTPPVATGSQSTASLTTTQTTATVDGLQASVGFSGMAPGFVGLNQINVSVPAPTRIGNDIAVTLSVGGKQSNVVTIPVVQ
jgi:uncharacterized protein (TIGR03437 family)